MSLIRRFVVRLGNHEASGEAVPTEECALDLLGAEDAGRGEVLTWGIEDQILSRAMWNLRPGFAIFR
jgi:hypothetical protein